MRAEAERFAAAALALRVALALKAARDAFEIAMLSPFVRVAKLIS